ncbi:alpha-amylase/4-alpha-glucanotransferase domain-containing protein [Treponema putidum]|uniref:DUF1926 domain-containing protein n=1 Tax=Treponema putidum TaxID=221027 RepID=A0ABY5HSB2_9SPIR|nr:alpha-amylase/4-alpha-glucanotransferase domain-containing protein [Treponema putidum]UTY28264.1 DUF1926 domain-containing protein [Treponema putidum]
MEKNSKKKLEICFAVHADYNIIDELSREDYTQEYKDFFSNLYASSSIPFTLVFSGRFLEWIQRKNSPFFDVIYEMHNRKQIEILGNAFYEPFISMIPSSDLIGQIEYMTDTLRKHSYKRPRGMYLPYFAWHPNIISNLQKCGMEYCLLDFRFFIKAGLNAFAPVCMEDGGKILFGIPSTYEFENTNLEPAAFYDFLCNYASVVTETSVVVFLSRETAVRFLDKSKGKKSWMEEFFERVSYPDSVISLNHAGQILKNKRIYQKGFISSNVIFSNQLANTSVKQLLYNKPNVYSMYSKMIYVHSLVNQVRGDKARKNNSLLDLWKAESGILFNLDYKHIKYNRDLRHYCYRNLLLAEKQTRIPGIFADSLTSLDFDLDGVKEFISQREYLNMYVHALGGKIFELDVFSAYKNYADICSEETGLFIDHLISSDELEIIKNGDFKSAVAKPVFSENLYQDVRFDRLKFELLMKTEGSFRSFNQLASLRKQYSFNDQGVQVQYILKNESPFNLSAYFMVEIDLAVSRIERKAPSVSVYADDQKYEASQIKNIFSKVSWIQIEEPEGKTVFTIESNEAAELIILLIYEKISEAKNPIMGLRNLFYWKVDLNSGFETEKLLFFKVDAKKTAKEK